MPQPSPRDLLRAMFDAAVAAAQPSHCVAPHLPAAPHRPPDRDRRRQGLGRHGASRRATLAR